MTTPLFPHAAALLETLEQDDLVGATDELARLVKDRVPVPIIIDDVISPVMVEVGRRWATNQWTAAQEHGATATVDAALAAIETRYLSSPGSGPPIVVACADGEWHALPARLAAARMRAQGHNVVFLGPSLPPDHLSSHLRRIGAAALGLSCTLPVNLVGARRCIEAAHASGIPVLVGGAAFDPAGRRATALGADAAPTIDDAAAFLEDPQLLDHPSRRFADRARQEAFDLETAFGPLVSATMAEISLRYPAAAWFDRTQSVRTRADLSWILRYCGAAIDVDDPTLFDDFLSWKRGVLAARGVPAEALTVCLDSLQHVLRPRFPRATRLIQQSRRISHVKRRKSVATAVA